MKTGYVLAHVLVQSATLSIGLFVLPLLGFLVTGTVWSSVGILAALTVARAVAFILGQFVGMKGYTWDMISMFLVATLTMIAFWLTGLGSFDGPSWFLMFFLLVFTYLFAHGVLRAAGARPGGNNNTG